MDEKARQEFQRADNELNTVYNQVLKKYSGDAAFLKKLRAAQLAWIRFRDAQVEAHFPATDKLREYGSVYPVCRYQALKPLTEERTKQLRVWLEEAGLISTRRDGRYKFHYLDTTPLREISARWRPSGSQKKESDE